MAPASTIPLYALYLLFWMCACVLLGLMAYQMDLNNYKFHVWVNIDQEILVTSAMAIVWVPISSFTIANSQRPGSRIVSFEILGASVLWIMYLVGAAIFTNKVFDGKGDCTPDMSKKDCDVMATILAFTWLQWCLNTFILVLSIFRIDNTPPVVQRKVAEV
ncbi:hypothetical protein BDZ89DRAFT_1108509 [Hymenopellis radicata]|nr:hypothetical protein BDZ89DRAFT_1108509 [Hymenopellis radicata]